MREGGILELTFLLIYPTILTVVFIAIVCGVPVASVTSPYYEGYYGEFKEYFSKHKWFPLIPLLVLNSLSLFFLFLIKIVQVFVGQLILYFVISFLLAYCWTLFKYLLDQHSWKFRFLVVFVGQFVFVIMGCFTLMKFFALHALDANDLTFAHALSLVVDVMIFLMMWFSGMVIALTPLHKKSI